ncbi:hypothetical protein [Actinomadura sp. WMMB 499]|uniref:hypothetical protein n=1 Tax=Actinomadura sp. WMMB 499 TaxID=1219491 RepID=UPI00159E44EC|nr:hypothetical protein [Actinomadura sp. WMMB 499]
MTNLQRMVTAIPLTDDERAAVDDGQAALDKLLEQLVNVPTPAGPTPRDLQRPAGAVLLPIVEVRQSGTLLPWHSKISGHSFTSHGREHRPGPTHRMAHRAPRTSSGR